MEVMVFYFHPGNLVGWSQVCNQVFQDTWVDSGVDISQTRGYSLFQMKIRCNCLDFWVRKYRCFWMAPMHLLKYLRRSNATIWKFQKTENRAFPIPFLNHMVYIHTRISKGLAVLKLRCFPECDHMIPVAFLP
jgi:hypothetical protein